MKMANNQKLTEKEILKIKSMLKNGNSNAHIARRFGVSPSTISNIKTLKVHVDVKEKENV